MLKRIKNQNEVNIKGRYLATAVTTAIFGYLVLIGNQSYQFQWNLRCFLLKKNYGNFGYKATLQEVNSVSWLHDLSNQRTATGHKLFKYHSNAERLKVNIIHN